MIHRLYFAVWFWWNARQLRKAERELERLRRELFA